MVTKNESERLLTLVEVADIMHVHPNTLRRWCGQGKITSYRISIRGDRRFKKSDIELFLANL